MKMIPEEWSKLSFAYYPTNYNVRCYYRDGKWGNVEISSSENIIMHISATALHYGQEIFEGLKAFRGQDGKIRIFRWQNNWERMNFSARGILVPEVPKEIFEDSITKVITLNKEFIPPYGTGASLYIRPLLIGTGAKLGVAPADEFLFMIFVSPVGPYFPTGFKCVDVKIERNVDRAATLGTGQFKIGGNYAASLVSGRQAYDEGFKMALYLDAKEKKYIDECGPANFFGIKNNTYITPDSSSILQSITNMSLRTLAKEAGLKVEQRKMPVEELSELEEAGACGTAAVITPIKSIHDKEQGKIYTYGNEPGEWSVKLYRKLQSIQFGDESDKYGWITEL
ncbi:MAG: branched-chain amino acid aminotransferase [Prevotellaceae bacterium]|jgi:branched-chain amino acid aminotransferase|nr:branched-chain amino acid aminotransferase [Prevotellaceae bacterium]